MTLSRICLLIAVIVFIFAAFGFNPFGLSLVPLGLAFFAGAGLV